MKSFKSLMNALSNDAQLRQLTEQEMIQLRTIFLRTFSDLCACCEAHHLTVMLIGGSALGAVRHQGFIPWDDDLDVAMTRADFEQLKTIFESELGDRYILSSPNYKNNARNRFPQMLVKHTRFLEAGSSNTDTLNKIKIDIFIIENIPDRKWAQMIRGIWCSALMFIASNVDVYQNSDARFEAYLCKTKEGKREYQRRRFWGKLFSFRNDQQWFNSVDRACQYKKETALMGIPSGRRHYFGEIRKKSTFLPPSKGTFEGLSVYLPGDPDDYLRNLYGQDYMTLPPVEKRERHFIYDIQFEKR